MTAYTIVVEQQGSKAKTLKITAPRVRIGRGSGEISLEDGMVSTKHGELTFQDGLLVYTDVGSSNGSFDGAGHRIEKSIELHEGDVVQLGQTIIRVKTIELPPAELPPAEDGSDKTIVDPNFRWPGDARSDAAPADRGDAQGAGGASGGYTPQASAANAAAGGGRPAAKDGGGAAGPASSREGGQASGGARASGTAGAGGRASAGAGASRPAASAPPVADDTSPVDLLKAGWGEFLNLIGKGTAKPAPPPDDAAPWLDVLKDGWASLQPHLKEAPIIPAVVSVPVALVTGLSTMVVALAPLVGLVSLVSIPFQIFAMAALMDYTLRAHLGRPIGWQHAWKSVLAKPVPLLVSIFLAGLLAAVGTIALIIPGIALGLFILPALVAEGRHNFSLNARSLQLYRYEPIRLLTLVVMIAVVSIVVSVVVGVVFGLIPAVGGLLGALVGAALGAVVNAWFSFVLARIYLEVRRRHEGGDPESEVISHLG